VDQIV